MQSLGVPPSQRILSVGGINFTDLDNLIILLARVVTAGNATTFRTIAFSSAGAGYTPSGAKAFRVWAARGMTSSGATANCYQIGQADNDIGIDAAGAGLTNPKTPGDMSHALAGPVMLPLAVLGASVLAGEVGFGKAGPLLANGKYLFATLSASATGFVTVFGYEE